MRRRNQPSVVIVFETHSTTTDNERWIASGWLDGQLSLAEEHLRRAAEQMASNSLVQDHFGDVLFSLVNLSRFLKVNPEDALRRATDRFADRFHFVEAEAARTGRTLDSMTLDEMDALWKKAKAREV